jgi:hypothetical protein
VAPRPRGPVSGCQRGGVCRGDREPRPAGVVSLGRCDPRHHPAFPAGQLGCRAPAELGLHSDCSRPLPFPAASAPRQ